MLLMYSFYKSPLPLTVFNVNSSAQEETPFEWNYTMTLDQGNINRMVNPFSYIGRFYLTMESDAFIFITVPQFVPNESGLAVRLPTTESYSVTEVDKPLQFYARKSEHTFSIDYPAIP